MRMGKEYTKYKSETINIDHTTIKTTPGCAHGNDKSEVEWPAEDLTSTPER
jgi:hypothetical protein